MIAVVCKSARTFDQFRKEMMHRYFSRDEFIENFKMINDPWLARGLVFSNVIRLHDGDDDLVDLCRSYVREV